MVKTLTIKIITEGLSSTCYETYELRTSIPDYFKIKKITYLENQEIPILKSE